MHARRCFWTTATGDRRRFLLLGERIAETVSDAQHTLPPAVNQNIAYSVNNLNQYASVGSVTPAYDSNGNLTTLGAGESYGYDKQNRLTTVTLAGLTTDFTYGPHGARRDKAVSGGATTRYLRSGPDVIAEYNGAALLARFIHGPGTDDPVAVIDNTGARHFYHADATGTIVALSGEAGLVEERYATDPFGAVDSASGLANYRFAGRPYGLETGLYYNRARYYHPGLGRFLSPDPTGYADGLNMYAYAANDPVNLADPSGLYAQAAKESVVAGFNVVSTAASKASATATRSLASGANAAAGFLERNEVAVATAITVTGFVIDVVTFPSGEGFLIAAGSRLAARGASTGLRAFARRVGGCSFAAGTMLMSTAGHAVAIEDLKLGDLVQAKDVETGDEAWKQTIAVLSSNQRRLYTLTVIGENGTDEWVETTDNHPFFVKGQGWIQTIDLAPGMAIETAGGGTAMVKSVIDSGRDAKTYNLEVAEYHTYYAYAGQTALLVHNACGGGTKSLKDQAAELVSKNSGKFRATLHSPSRKIEVDLAGKSHGGVPTPHTKSSPRNLQAPNQPVYNTKKTPTLGTTQQEIRMIRKFLERQ